jgi:hypothetical protein
VVIREGREMLTMDGSGFHKEGQHLAADWQHLAVCWQHSARGRQQAPAGLSKLPQHTASSRRAPQVLAGHRRFCCQARQGEFHTPERVVTELKRISAISGSISHFSMLPIPSNLLQTHNFDRETHMHREFQV